MKIQDRRENPGIQNRGIKTTEKENNIKRNLVRKKGKGFPALFFAAWKMYHYTW